DTRSLARAKEASATSASGACSTKVATCRPSLYLDSAIEVQRKRPVSMVTLLRRPNSTVEHTALSSEDNPQAVDTAVRNRGQVASSFSPSRRGPGCRRHAFERSAVDATTDLQYGPAPAPWSAWGIS